MNRHLKLYASISHLAYKIVEYLKEILMGMTDKGIINGEGDAAFNELFRNYKRSAKARNKPFELTEEQFKALTKQNCHYCGSEPIKKYKEGRFTSDYVYNGIDRVDNSLGYTVDNSVACCGDCNFMKHMATKEEFLSHVNKIYLFGKR